MPVICVCLILRLFFQREENIQDPRKFFSLTVNSQASE